MPHCKVVFVGAGSYVFGPAPLRDLFDRHRLKHLELALVDPNPQMLHLMAGVAESAGRKHQLSSKITTHPAATADALAGADFVICAVAIEQRKRFAIDQSLIERHAPGHLISEFGGIYGISSSLRQIAMIRELCSSIRQHCPNAWLLNVANPLPRVCQAAHQLGVRTAGFCSASLSSYPMLWKILHDKDLPYPFEPAISQLRLTIAGLNHHTFVTDIRDQAGNDLRPLVLERLASGATSGNRRAEAMMRDHGALLAVQDGHTHDFFAPSSISRPLNHISHGNEAERQHRLQLLAAIGSGNADPTACFEPQAWEFPGDFVASVAYGTPVRFHSLNLINQGQIPQLPRNVFVETAATGARGVVKPDHIDLPAEVVPYCLRTLAVTDMIVQAGVQKRMALVNSAIELDPTITDKSAAQVALGACLQAHEDLIGTFD